MYKFLRISHRALKELKILSSHTSVPLCDLIYTVVINNYSVNKC